MMNKRLEQKQTEIFKKYGVFFAFSNEQFRENADKSIEYVSMGSGMICPRAHASKVVKELFLAKDQACKEELEEKGREGIIHYELANHECQITMDMDPAVDAVFCYGITREEVQAYWPKFLGYCLKNDCF